MIRTTKPLSILLATALLLGPLALAVRAQPQPPPQPQPQPQIQPTEPGQQTLQSLKKMLDDMGYDFKEDKGTDSKGSWDRYLVTVPSGGRNWPIFVEISPNQENLWLSVVLAKAPDPKNVPREILEAMLKANDPLGPCYFALDRLGYFMMFQPMTNRGVTPKMLRQRLELIAGNVLKYENVWNPAKWAPARRPSCKS